MYPWSQIFLKQVKGLAHCQTESFPAAQICLFSGMIYETVWIIIASLVQKFYSISVESSCETSVIIRNRSLLQRYVETKP